MDFDLLGSLGWREGLIAVIVLLVTYIIVLYLRMRRLQRGGVTSPPLAAQAAQAAAYAAVQESASEQGAAATAVDPVVAVAAAVSAPPPSGSASVAAPDAPAGAEPASPEFAWNEPPAGMPGQAWIDSLQREVYQLRCEVDELRTEVLAAREDFRQQSRQSTGSPPAAAPLYNDAMQMAIQGHDATTIAHHCGIARAEADLVVALARNRYEGV
ncbi:MAG TPA: DUF2802 domain-containing protein [Accumulibacter sp.]|uniref:DUF2802 domain-containing protein n=2 Tax=Candidatus Accumulibacter TaxID=327159 RepID=A0A080ML53_9PROT|nr:MULTISPECIES: DUF2802 domain-containing protein [Candidatus Accumulibacter]KFB78354.1 MAG: hypothetical protein AW06_000305 [Candidatus Accumulibacter cognatus]MBN8516710.1 DUF2802 domain-containing protein [Accumulibacter sp.]MBO3710783.1 DUF2802 domain-containing protein [Accumulibacter sp.]MCC2868519.1 DUF2802 domain-containing protein [Candidatus Accumulibacter phosphatis]MCM8580528.1 DUF2802 domain-containing protein [Accumulibacter sp.]